MCRIDCVTVEGVIWTNVTSVRHRYLVERAIFSIYLLAFDFRQIPMRTFSFSLWTIIFPAHHRHFFVVVAVVFLVVDVFVGLCTIRMRQLFFFLIISILCKYTENIENILKNLLPINFLSSNNSGRLLNGCIPWFAFWCGWRLQ